MPVRKVSRNRFENTTKERQPSLIFYIIVCVCSLTTTVMSLDNIIWFNKFNGAKNKKKNRPFTVRTSVLNEGATIYIYRCGNKHNYDGLSILQ